MTRGDFWISFFERITYQVRLSPCSFGLLSFKRNGICLFLLLHTLASFRPAEEEPALLLPPAKEG